MHACVYVCMHACMCVCVYVWYACVFSSGALTIPRGRAVSQGLVVGLEPQRVVAQMLGANVQLSMSNDFLLPALMYIYIYVYVCMYIYIYIYPEALRANPPPRYL